MDLLILHNDRIVPLAEACLSPGQSGLLAGWGVFTTLRLYGGRPFEFHRHWVRLARDAARLGVALPYEEESVGRQITALAGANRREEGMARLWLVRNDGGLWAAQGATPLTDLLAATRELVPWPLAHRLLIQPAAIFSPGLLAGAKMLSWAQHALLLERARAQGFDDALLLNEKGELAECTSANVFLVRQGKVLTPPLASGCLPGVTREILFEIAPSSAIELAEHALTSDDLDSADEVFISSTTREVAGVGLVSPNRSYAAPGPITRELEGAFQEYVAAVLGKSGTP
jgi:branched-chain amino acid aminotransferase